MATLDIAASPARPPFLRFFHESLEIFYGFLKLCIPLVPLICVAYGMIFGERTVLFMMLFPMKAWVFAVIMGAIVFLNSAGVGGGGNVSNAAHLGGLVIGYLYLKGPRNLTLNLQYRMARWRMDRMRRKFNVHRGGRDDWENRLH